MYPVIYHVDVSFDLPKALLPESLVRWLKPEDRGPVWRMAEHVKIGVEERKAPPASAVRDSVRQGWPGARNIAVWTGHEFFL